jgi:hypothetical protein
VTRISYPPEPPEQFTLMQLHGERPASILAGMVDWPATPAEELAHLFRGFWVSQAIYVAAALGLADLLGDGQRSVDDLATATATDRSALYRVLRLLASEGVFEETDPRWFALTPRAAALRGDSPVRLSALFLGSSGPWQAAGELMHTVRTGEPAFEHAHGIDFFEYNRRHPDHGRLFDQLMVAQTLPVARAVAAAYDFQPFRSILDLGGGLGVLAIEILLANEHLRATIFDQPHVADQARDALAAAGLDGRCKAVGGDFFTEVPSGADVHLLKFILHDWDDERAVALLSECRRAMCRGGRLLVVETLIPPGNSPSYAKTQDINMLINLGGRERTKAGFKELMYASGFELTRTIPVLGEIHIIEGIPVP